MSESAILWNEWCMIAMSYDGQQDCSWYNGRCEPIPEANPYLMGGPLHVSGPHGSDFTVGAVDRSGEMGNFFTGLISAIAIYERALTPAEMYALYHATMHSHD